MEKTHTPAPKRETAQEAFHRELDEIRPSLPKDWRTRFFLRRKDYDSYRGGELLNRVMSRRSTDNVILETLREIAAEHEAEQQKASA
jgi:hypothetical protein